MTNAKPGFPPREFTPGTSAFDRRCAELARVLFHEWAHGCSDFEPIDQDHADGLIGQIRNLLMRELHRAHKEHAAILSAAEVAKEEAVREARAAVVATRQEYCHCDPEEQRVCIPCMMEDKLLALIPEVR